MFDSDLSECPPNREPPAELFSKLLRPWGQVRQAGTGMQARKEAALASSSPNWPIPGLSPWQRPCCRGPSSDFPVRPSDPSIPAAKPPASLASCQLPLPPPKPNVRVWPSLGDASTTKAKPRPFFSLGFPLT